MACAPGATASSDTDRGVGVAPQGLERLGSRSAREGRPAVAARVVRGAVVPGRSAGPGRLVGRVRFRDALAVPTATLACAPGVAASATDETDGVIAAPSAVRSKEGPCVLEPDSAARALGESAKLGGLGGLGAVEGPAAPAGVSWVTNESSAPDRSAGTAGRGGGGTSRVGGGKRAGFSRGEGAVGLQGEGLAGAGGSAHSSVGGGGVVGLAGGGGETYGGVLVVRAVRPGVGAPVVRTAADEPALSPD